MSEVKESAWADELQMKRKNYKKRTLQPPKTTPSSIARQKKRKTEQTVAQKWANLTRPLYNPPSLNTKNKHKGKKCSNHQSGEEQARYENVVISTGFSIEGIPLNHIKYCFAGRFDPHIYSAVKVSMRGPDGSGSFYETGTAGFTGAKDPMLALQMAYTIALRMTQLFKKRVDISNAKVVNFVVSERLGMRVNLKELHAKLLENGQTAQLDDQFPGLCWRMCTEKNAKGTCAIIFEEGEVNVVGLKDISDYPKVQSELMPMLRELVNDGCRLPPDAKAEVIN
jgi:TATA-box binding protein (TBP) (component of TFIID and TFIIIB)